MFGMIGIGINIIVLVTLFGVYSKLNELGRAVRRLAAAQGAAPSAQTPPGPGAA